MAALTFDAQLFDSQAIPDPLPELPAAQPTANPGGVQLTHDQASYMGSSSGFPGIGFIDTPDKAIQHHALVMQQREAQAALVAADKARDPVLRQQQRAQRAAQGDTIETARLAWKQAVEQRRVELAKWDAYVRSLHDAYNKARNGA